MLFKSSDNVLFKKQESEVEIYYNIACSIYIVGKNLNIGLVISVGQYLNFNI